MNLELRVHHVITMTRAGLGGNRIAEELGCSVTAVKNAARKGRIQLRRTKAGLVKRPGLIDLEAQLGMSLEAFLEQARARRLMMQEAAAEAGISLNRLRYHVRASKLTPLQWQDRLTVEQRREMQRKSAAVRTKSYPWHGRMVTVRQLMEELGISKDAAYSRLMRHGGRK